MFGIQILEQVQSGLRGVKSELNGNAIGLRAQAATDLAAMVSKSKALLKARAGDEKIIAIRNRRLSQNNLKQLAWP